MTIGILIAQDLAFLPMLLVVEHLGTGGIGISAGIKIFVAVALLALLVRVLSRRKRIDLPVARVVAGHADLSPLTGLVYCFGAGALFGVLGLSAPYGAFLAGLVIGRSAQREQMVQSVRPVQSVLVMVSFLSIGLLIDLNFVWANLGTVVALLLVVTLFKTAMNVAIMRLLGETWPRAFLQGLLISQLGEFSFLLAASGLAAGAVGQEESRLVIAVTVLSLALSPIWLITARRVHGLAATGVLSLRDILGSTYSGEAEAVRRNSTRFAHLLGRTFAQLAATDTRSTPEQAAEQTAAAPEQGDTTETLAAIGSQVRAAASYTIHHPPKETTPVGESGVMISADGDDGAGGKNS